MELGTISPSDLAADPETGRPVAALDRLDETLAYARGDGLSVALDETGHSCVSRKDGMNRGPSAQRERLARMWQLPEL